MWINKYDDENLGKWYLFLFFVDFIDKGKISSILGSLLLILKWISCEVKFVMWYY